MPRGVKGSGKQADKTDTFAGKMYIEGNEIVYKSASDQSDMGPDRRIEELTKKVEMLVDVVGMITEKVMQPVQSDAKTVIKLEEDIPKKNEDLNLMIPVSWRRIINENLGENFDAKVEDSCGNFLLYVYLPKELDRRIGEEKTAGLDYSTGFIRRASADSDVEYWCEKIKNNIQKTYPSFKN